MSLAPSDIATVTAMVVSSGTLLIGLLGLRWRLDQDYLAGLERRVRESEVRVTELEREVTVLRAENLELMRKLVAQQRNGP